MRDYKRALPESMAKCWSAGRCVIAALWFMDARLALGTTRIGTDNSKFVSYIDRYCHPFLSCAAMSKVCSSLGSSFQHRQETTKRFN